MARLETVRCDRCGDESTNPATSDWARAYAATLAGKDVIGTLEHAADLCPGCLDQLLQWFRGDVQHAPDTSERLTFTVDPEARRAALADGPAGLVEVPCGGLLPSDPPKDDLDWLLEQDFVPSGKVS